MGFAKRLGLKYYFRSAPYAAPFPISSYIYRHREQNHPDEIYRASSRDHDLVES